MQGAALAAAGLPHRYQRLPVPPDLFRQTVTALPELGFLGVNVTIPHKEAAIAVADHVDPEAAAIGAANTLRFERSGIRAYNTDGRGVIKVLEQVLGEGALAGVEAVVLGAGGSARAVLYALRQAGARVAVWARRPEQARRLASELGVGLVERPQPSQLVVNCTPVGLAQANSLPIEQSATAADLLNQVGIAHDQLDRYGFLLDLVYGTAQTPLVEAFRAAGRPALDGRAVLLWQGALSFEHWFGYLPPLEPMAAALDLPWPLAAR
jgi:shikimate dehydrogenase